MLEAARLQSPQLPSSFSLTPHGAPAPVPTFPQDWQGLAGDTDGMGDLKDIDVISNLDVLLQETIRMRNEYEYNVRRVLENHAVQVNETRSAFMQEINKLERQFTSQQEQLGRLEDILSQTAPPEIMERLWARGEVPSGSLYVIGGYNLASTERYDPITNTWWPAASMSTKRANLGATFYRGCIYAVGGSNTTEGILRSVERYDPIQDSWQTVAPLHQKREWHACASVGGMMYVVGGTDGVTPLSTVERYDASTGQWSYAAPMCTQRSCLSVLEADGKLFAVGGTDGANYLSSVEVYEPGRNHWQPIGTLQSGPRCSLATAVIGHDVYILGGGDGMAQNTASRHCFTHKAVAHQEWRCKDMRSRRAGHAAVALQGRIYAVGGHDGLDASDSMECYHPGRNDWVACKPMTTKRQGLAAAVVC